MLFMGEENEAINCVLTPKNWAKSQKCGCRCKNNQRLDKLNKETINSPPQKVSDFQSYKKKTFLKKKFIKIRAASRIFD